MRTISTCCQPQLCVGQQTKREFPKEKWEQYIPGKATESPNGGSAERKAIFVLPGHLRSMGTLSLGARKTYSGVGITQKRIKKTQPAHRN